ncbi:MAG: hypothetical protein AAF492_29940 [Verrucomicrobiota bacterium]
MWRYFKEKGEEFFRRYFKPIPEEFHSSETGALFERCLECDGDLTDENADYIIEKGIQDDEVVYEFALCDACCKDLRNDLSKESRRFIEHSLKRPLLKATTEGCRICGLPRHELPSYVLVGACLGTDMIFWNVPFLLCDPCLEKISTGLSRQTRDVLDDFEERNFPGPPEMEIDLPKPKRKPVLI